MNRFSETALSPVRSRLLVLGVAGAICGAVLISAAAWHERLSVFLDGHLIFTTFAEFSGNIMSFAIFTVGWYGYKQRSDLRPLVLALIFFAVGVLDFAHTFSVPGMPDFITANSFEKSDSFSEISRLIAAVGLLSLVFVTAKPPPRWMSRTLLFATVFAFILGLILLISYRPENVAPVLMESRGLSTFNLKYVMISLGIVTIAILQTREVFGVRSTLLLQLAIVIGVFSALAFMIFASGSETNNLVGHLFKTVSYYFILRAIFVASLQQPYWELKKTREDLEQSFSSIGAALASSLELDRALSLISVLASDLLDSPHALVALKQESDQRLAVKASRGITDPPTDIWLKNNLAARVWETHEPVWIDDTTDPAQPFRSVIASSEGLRSALAAPIMKDSQILGEIAVYSERPAAFSEPEARLLAAFARQAAVAIENARLFEIELDSKARMESYAAQLSILHNISLQLNRETDTGRLLETVLTGAMQLTEAGVGLITLVEDNKLDVISIQYAGWYKQRCGIETNEQLHQRITRRLASRGRESLRIPARAGMEMQLPPGHLSLRGLLMGSIRDTQGRIKGHFLVSDKAGGGEFTVQDEEIIALLAAQSSVALISAENFEREHYVAESLQSSLLPAVPVREDLELGLLYQSAGPYGRVGGDFYDFVELENGDIAVVIGDVCGKGLEAATYTAMIKFMLRAYLGEGMLPGNCLTRLNANIRDQISIDKFITASLAIIDTKTGTMNIASAGHPPPIACRKGKASTLQVSGAIPLGVLDNQQYSSSRIDIGDVCHIVFYSDGLIEARPEGGKPFGEKRAIDEVLTGCKKSAQITASNLAAAAVNYSEGQLKDDIALLVVGLRC